MKPLQLHSEKRHPQYLRYKTVNPHGTQAEQDWRQSLLEKANGEVHRRLLRKVNDGLCANCARLNPKKVKGSFSLRWFDTRDGIPWDQLEVVGGPSHRLVELLAGHPEYKWVIRRERTAACRLCDTLFDIAQEFASLETLDLIKISLARQDSVLSEHQLFGKDHVCSSGRQNDPIPLVRIQAGSITRSFTIRPFMRNLTRPARDNADEAAEEQQWHHCVARRPLSDNVDFALVASWLQTCYSSHSHWKDKVPSPTKFLPHVRFINIKERCIVRSSLNEQFAALSYTWGASKQYQLTLSRLRSLEKPYSLLQASRRLAEVVTDAIRACEELNIPYLWVDSLCIVQDDPDEKHDQIARMDLIYSSAYVTLVAAEGENADSGLARVSTPATCKTRTFEVDHTSYELTEHTEEPVARSTWVTRGWTFQEMLFSNRVLAFTSVGTSFHCPNSVHSEILYASDRPLSMLNSSGIQLLGSTLEKFRHRSRVRSRLEVAKDAYGKLHIPLLNRYLSRNLTYEDDHLSAFSGVLSAEEDVLGPCRWGLPVNLLARALLWSLVGPTGGVYESGETNWGSSHQMDRRPGFPSWTWAGWKLWKEENIVQDPTKGMKFLPLVHIHCYNRDNQLVSLLGPFTEAQGVEGYHPVADYHFPEFAADLAHPLTPEEVSIPPKHSQPLYSSYILIFWASVATFRVDRGPNGFIHRSRFRLYDVFGPSRTTVWLDRKWRESQPDHLEFILIGERDVTHNGSRVLHTMLIERHGGIAYRVGIPKFMHKENWNAANPRRELIILA